MKIAVKKTNSKKYLQAPSIEVLKPKFFSKKKIKLGTKQTNQEHRRKKNRTADLS